MGGEGGATREKGQKHCAGDLCESPPQTVSRKKKVKLGERGLMRKKNRKNWQQK